MSEMNRVVFLGLLASCLLVGCATSPSVPGAAAPFRDSLVVPDTRIGPAVLGMTETQMLEWLGRPDETVGSGDSAYRYTREGLQIAFDQGVAYVVAVIRPGFATADGVSVGTAEREVRAKWGEPTKSHELSRCIGKDCEEAKVETVQYCFRNGMQIEIDSDRQRVALLQVGARGCALP